MPMSPELRRKLAVLGATYARALSNAATRGGRALSPAMSSKITQLNAQPQARLQPGLGQMFREHAAGGAIAPTAKQQDMQNMLAQVPWAGEEHGGSPFAESTLNAQLRHRGLEHNTPAGQPNVHQQIAQRFGPAQAPRRPTQIGHASGDQTTVESQRDINARQGMGTFGGSLLDVFEGPAGHTGHLPELTRAGVGPQPRAMQRRPLPQVGRSETPITGAGGHARPTDGTAVLKAAAFRLPAAAGVGLPLALGGAMLARKPGVQASFRAMQEGGSTQERDIAGAIPQEALGQADAIHQALIAHGIDPMSVRMGIDAPPGSGKTTLAKAIHQRTGIKHYGLDWLPGNALHSTIGLGRNIENTPRAPHAGEVLEHYMLGRTYDPELFDAMVHIRRDPALLRHQLQQRGHGGYIGDTMDLDKSLGVADLGFDTLGGETVDLGGGVQMKLRPREGWGNALDEQLQQRGIDPSGLSRHEKLLSLHAGERTTGAGWTPYIKNPFSTGETLALGASIPLGVMAARALRRGPKLASDDSDDSTLHKALPYLAAAGVGLGTYGLMRKFRPSSVPALAKLQQAARKTKYEVATENPVGRRLRSFLSGARDVPHAPSSAAGEAFSAAHPGKTVLHHTPNGSAVAGDVNINAGVLPGALDDKYMFSQLMGESGTSGGAFPGMPGAIPDTHLLRDVLQQHRGDLAKAKDSFPNGYVIKPRVGSMSKAESLMTHETPMHDPRLRQALRNPGEFIIQEKIPIEREFRVHTVNGVPFTATHRSIPNEALRDMWNKHMGGGGGAFVPVMGDTRKSLMQFAQDATKHLGVSPSGENLLGQSEHLHHALDIAQLPDGSFKLIESNPTPGTLMNPITARKLQRMATGRWDPNTSALAGVGAAGLAGLAAHEATKDDEDETLRDKLRRRLG